MLNLQVNSSKEAQFVCQISVLLEEHTPAHSFFLLKFVS